MDLLGVDGCKGGWYAAMQDARTGAVTTRVFPAFDALLAWAPAPALIAVDMPIGLSSAEHRACDAHARKLLRWPRSASVFQAPARQTLRARSYREACDENRKATGKGISQQAYNILPKIAEVDEALRANARDVKRVFEVHPELAFMQMRIERHSERQSERHSEHGKESEAAGLKEGKTTNEGHALRKALLERAFGTAVETALAERVARHVKKDDVLDAFAVLWSARRIAAGCAVMLPGDAPHDSAGLPMVIRY